jgi:Stage II sporulation protein E (SpoIIE)/Histidine kinase-like ATPase domain
LRRLDEWCRTLSPGTGADSPDGTDPPMVSCTYLVYDAWSRTLSFANAGHDAPLLIVGSEVGELDMEHKGVLLGLRGKGVPALPTYHEETRYLPAGSALVLYTDGLTDRRHRPDGTTFSEDDARLMLHQAVRRVAYGDVESIAQAAQDAVPGDIDDDMAIVAIRTSKVDLSSWEGTFPAEPIKVSETRRLAEATFQSWGMDPEQVELTCLLVSEVVTNAVLHTAVSRPPRRTLALEAAGAGAPGSGLGSAWGQVAYSEENAGEAGKTFSLRLRRGGDSVWVEVFDNDLRLPRIRSAGETDEGGRGLYLVDQLATRWGSRPTRDGKAVWFEMPLRRGPAS